jgi:NDP-4-keto-2,6-dideoxyhexose 3-C-methyltransferase
MSDLRRDFEGVGKDWHAPPVSPPAAPAYTTITHCRACGKNDLTPLYSLGAQVVSDFVPPDADPLALPRVPINVVLCDRCGLVQQLHSADPAALYSRHYWYRSGTTETMRRQLADVVRSAWERANVRPLDHWLDIGANDGTLLREVGGLAHIRGVPLGTVGVEPATNFADDPECRAGVDCWVKDFWPCPVVAAPRVGFTVVTAIGMLYDLEDPGAFLRGVRDVLHPEGVFVAQLQCLRSMMELGDVGNLCHEHLEFYPLRTLLDLYARCGLEIFDCELNGVNGGSYRLYARRAGAAVGGAPSSWVGLALTEEDAERYDKPWVHRHWYQRLRNNRDRLVELVYEAREFGPVWAYGASTKGNVILQWAGLSRAMIAAAADRDPRKHGLVTAGTGIPIVPEAEFRKAAPPHALALPYAFIKEFTAREAAWRAGGGKFIVPLPEPEVV